MSEFITRGLNQNLDVAAANERINEAIANLRGTGINAALSGGLSGSYLRSGNNGITTTTGTTGLDASFVIDLFGAIEQSRQGALASVDAAQADIETTRLAWLAELISSYTNARYYQEALELSRDTIATRN